MRDELDFPDSEHADREARDQLRCLPVCFVMFVLGMLAGLLLSVYVSTL